MKYERHWQNVKEPPATRSCRAMWRSGCAAALLATAEIGRLHTCPLCWCPYLALADSIELSSRSGALDARWLHRSTASRCPECQCSHENLEAQTKRPEREQFADARRASLSAVAEDLHK